MKFPLYEYEWYDHYKKTGWQDPAEFQGEVEPFVIYGTGYLFHEDKLYYYFTDGMAPKNRTYNDVMAILKSAVKRKKLIKTVTL